MSNLIHDTEHSRMIHSNGYTVILLMQNAYHIHAKQTFFKFRIVSWQSLFPFLSTPLLFLANCSSRNSKLHYIAICYDRHYSYVAYLRSSDIFTYTGERWVECWWRGWLWQMTYSDTRPRYTLDRISESDTCFDRTPTSTSSSCSCACLKSCWILSAHLYHTAQTDLSSQMQSAWLLNRLWICWCVPVH